MTRRFAETDKWQDEWFLSLPFEAKLLFLYLNDNCDCAGFWEVNCEHASRKTGLPLRGGTLLSGAHVMTLEDAMDELRGKLIWRDDGAVLYIKNFLRDQANWPLGKDPYSIGIVKRFDSHGSFGTHVLNVLRANEPERLVSDMLFGDENPLRRTKKKGPSKGLPSALGNGNGKKGGAGGKHVCAHRSQGSCVGPAVHPHGEGTANPWWLCEAHEASWKVRYDARQATTAE